MVNLQHPNKWVNATLKFIIKEFKNAEGGHDLYHTLRVHQHALKIAQQEECNLLVVELAALLHDIADAKFNNGDEEIGPITADEFLNNIDCDVSIRQHVVDIIRNVSFKGGNEKKTHDSIELDIVQDADRLEAIGAIGIARTFNYGGHKGRAIFDPSIPPMKTMTKKQYKFSTAPTINHFYEKLLLLKNKMNTKSGRSIAQKRHDFLLKFLEQFYEECNFVCNSTPFDIREYKI